jgi:hypothetical protein
VVKKLQELHAEGYQLAFFRCQRVSGDTRAAAGRTSTSTQHAAPQPCITACECSSSSLPTLMQVRPPVKQALLSLAHSPHAPAPRPPPPSPPPIRSNQGGIKGALNGKASDNVRGKVDGMLEALEKKAPGVQAQVWGARGAGCGGARGEPKSTTCHTFWRETRCVGGAGGARVGGKQPCS